MKICTPLSEILPVKNVAGVIKAVSLLKDKKAILNIVGGGDVSDLRQLAKDLKISSQVVFWGRLENKKAKTILKSCDVFVLNSFHEGMPHAMIEALSVGVLVVGTKIPAITEVLTDRVTGLLVDVDNPSDLAEKLKVVSRFKKTLIPNGKKVYKDKFTWGSHLSKLYNIFDEVASGSVRIGNN